MKKAPILFTQYTYEKRWQKTSKVEALKMILEEMADTDAEGTFAYILTETSKGKIVTLGTCRFKSNIL
jgi:hypothetical protein